MGEIRDIKMCAVEITVEPGVRHECGDEVATLEISVKQTVMAVRFMENSPSCCDINERGPVQYTAQKRNVIETGLF